jgi:hypothetical protein
VWNVIRDRFKKYPSQEKVVKLLLEYGFQVNERNRVCVDNIDIPHAQIGEQAGVDRRVVDAACRLIRSDEFLSKIFENLHVMAFLRDVAPFFNLGVIVIEPVDAHQKGLLGKVATKVAEHDISIRQAVSDDPYLADNPVLTIITENKVSGELVEELISIPGVKGVTVY